MIRLTNVSRCFNAGRPNRFLALDDVSLTIGREQLTVFKGPSGSGKTTLLSLIGCMSRPTSGRIYLSGLETSFMKEAADGVIDISSLPERFLTEIRRQHFGFIFQQFNLLRGISVLENIMLPAYPTGENLRLFRQRGCELLETFGISRHAGARVELLSGGELQRVAIARALINDPAVIIADEPTAHLDSTLSAGFMEIVDTLRRQGKTVIIASHDPIVFAHPQVDTLITMRDGKVVAGSGA